MIDRTFRLWVLTEHRLEYQRGVLAAYVDFKKAFDSEHRGSFWELLRRHGIPAGILSPISTLYTSMESANNSGENLSRFFFLTFVSTV